MIDVEPWKTRTYAVTHSLTFDREIFDSGTAANGDGVAVNLIATA